MATKYLYERRQEALHLVEVLGGMLVEDHDIGMQALHAPVLLREQHLTHQRHALASVTRTSTIGRSPEMP